MNVNFAPGARVEIRDAEWVIRRVDQTSDNGYQLTCDGISELVRGKEAIFLSKLEEDGHIKILDPATTRLVQDTSNAFEQSLLYIESQLRQATPNDEKIHIGHRAAMDVVPYQLDPAIQALQQPRQRILIADAVGLGKTLEAGILVTELIQRGRGKRILVLTLKSMMTQFQKEFWNRFTIPLTRLDSLGLQRVRSRIPGNHNPFYYYDKAIISIDTLKQDNEFKTYLEQSYWDIIVIDEAHNVADRGTSSQRSALAQLLANRSDTLIMLSATPHDGRAKSFASLMNMLDPTAISDPENYVKEDFRNKGLVIRRFKKDIKDQVSQEFKERTVHSLRHSATLAEEAVYEALLAIPFTYNGKFDKEKQGHLVRIGLQKALFSSPMACLASVEERIKKLSANENINEDIQAELNGLGSLKLAIEAVNISTWSKYQQFIGLLKSPEFAWDKDDTSDRLVIFSERLDTLAFLQAQLSKDIKLKPAQIAQLHGGAGLSDIDIQAIVEDFGKPESPLRVLLCSDIASEGINLHYLSHRLVHFDLPWSLMVFQQRNGRVDRYGQIHDPHIYYLITESANETIRGDVRILEILQQKDEQAYRNIGDPATFMKVHDAEREEQLTEEAMAEGMAADAFNQKYQADNSNEGDDLLALFFNTEAPVSTPEAELPLAESYSIYPSDYAFVRAAFEYLNRDKARPVADVSFNDRNHTVSLIAPEDLRERFRYLPGEIWPENGEFLLTADVKAYQQECARSRNDEHAWPKQHYLWAKHPAIEWLQERMLGNTGRHEAMVLGLNDGIGHDEAIFLVSALIPNRKASPVIWEWYAVFAQKGTITAIRPLQDVLKQFDFGNKPRPNTGRPVDIDHLNNLRQAVVDATKAEVLKKREAFEQEMIPRLKQQLDELRHLRGKQVEQLELALERSAQDQKFKEGRRASRMNSINEIFTHYQHWVEETLQTEPAPYIQIIAVLARVQG